MTDTLSLGAPQWLVPALVLAGVAALVLVRAYRASPGALRLRLGAAALKALGLLALAACLVDPLVHGTRPRSGANIFVLLADNSESLTVRDEDETTTRGEALRALLERDESDASWQTRLAQDFDAQRYLFDGRLRAVEDFAALDFTGRSTAVGAILDAIRRRYRDRPLAGVLLFSDGNATDLEGRELDATDLPPIYPVVMGSDEAPRDVGASRVTVSQTNFETAPVSVLAEIAQQGFDGEEISAQLIDEDDELAGEVIQRADETGRLTARFELRPRAAGIHIYRLRVAPRAELEQADGADAPADADASSAAPDAAVEATEDDVATGGDPAPAEPTTEATLANNERLVIVDRTSGPYRVLYVSGRPNWDFKFLRRALEDDDEVELVGLVRIAKREPKFDYRSRYGESTNPLFRGFGAEENEDAERYDQPVLLRIGTVDADELRDGFPKAADQLFRYDAVLLDDVESEYFTHDQMSLLREFVSRRGGGLMMLGGQECFAEGKYARTPIGELLPVYIDTTVGFNTAREGYRFALSREGRVQPWVRLRETEPGEEMRLAEMPTFYTLNAIRGIKPGATVMAHAVDARGDKLPALVTQRFGRGRSAALLVGDLYRWALRRPDQERNDQATAWRQMVRWLVAEVPRRVEAEVDSRADDPSAAARLTVRVRDAEYEPLENATVVFEVTGPDGGVMELAAEASASEAGLYEVDCAPRLAGAYRASVKTRGPDGEELEERELGWAAEPAALEYASLRPNRALLERLAKRTGGEVVAASDLREFVEGLQERKVPITDPWTYPLWHRWSVFAFAVLCLCAEWALRRWRGLP